MRWLEIPLFFVMLFAPVLAPSAHGVEDRLCRFILVDENNDRDDLELRLDLARSEAAAAQEIYVMIERLWKESAVERMVFLAAKHDREATRIDVGRRTSRLERQEAVIDQYRYLCQRYAGDKSAESRDALDAAFRRYHEAQCDVLEHDVAVAEADIEYLREFLQSILDLLEGDVATPRDVIQAERDVEMASKRLEQGRRRLSACREGS